MLVVRSGLVAVKQETDSARAFCRQPRRDARAFWCARWDMRWWMVGNSALSVLALVLIVQASPATAPNSGSSAARNDRESASGSVEFRDGQGTLRAVFGLHEGRIGLFLFNSEGKLIGEFAERIMDGWTGYRLYDSNGDAVARSEASSRVDRSRTDLETVTAGEVRVQDEFGNNAVQLWARDRFRGIRITTMGGHDRIDLLTRQLEMQGLTLRADGQTMTVTVENEEPIVRWNGKRLGVSR